MGFFWAGGQKKTGGKTKIGSPKGSLRRQIEVGQRGEPN